MQGEETELSLEQIVESRDAERVMQEIHEKYGFWVTPEYAADLIAFVDALILTGQAQDDAKWMHVWEGEAAQRVYQRIEAMRAEDS